MWVEWRRSSSILIGSIEIMNAATHAKCNRGIGMGKRRLRAPRKTKGTNMTTVHDRRATILPINASVRVVTVDDPYEAGAKIQAIASLRDDPLGRLHARDQIDQAQYEAGRHWQRLWSDAQIGGLKAMDTTKEPVDGGRTVSEPFTDRNRRAIRELGRLSRVLGLEGESLVRDVLGNRMFADQVAASRGISSRRGIAYISARFRECLETLATEFGYA